MLLVWLFTVPAVLPLIQPTITHSADGLLHLYRVMALQQAIQQGGLFPRWLPDLAYGYGFPLFVFYAPLAYYITFFISLIPGLTLAAAFNISFILAAFTGGTGLYLFAKTLLGSRASLLAAVAYVYAPFQLYNTLFRGSLPAAWAMAIFPFVFWIVTRLIKESGSTSRLITPLLPAGALIFGAALLTHNTLSLLFVPLLGLYLGLALLIQLFSGQFRWQSWIQIAAALLLGAGLAAFFLMPAIIEKEFAQVERVIISPDFDFRFNFVTLRQLLSLPEPANTGLLNPNVPLTLGLAQVALAAVGLAGGTYHLWRQRTAQNNASPLSCPPAPLLIILFSTLALITSIFMMQQTSTQLWKALPLIAFIQFPHRLLGPTALVLAILAGLAVAGLPHRAGFWLSGVGILLIFLAAAPLLYPRYQNALPAEPTPLDMMAYEHNSGAIGTTSFGEYLPIWVTQIPRESPLEAMYQNGAPIDRLAADYLPAGADIKSMSYGFNQVDVVINAPAPVQAVFHIFYFPGWVAQVDGQTTATTPFSERGLIVVPMPAGRHHLFLSFQETPVRKAANAVSIISLLIVMTLFTVTRHSSLVTRHSSFANSGFRTSELVALGGLALFLVAAKIVVLDRFDTPLKHTFDGRQVQQADVLRVVNFGNQINLLGYTLDSNTTQPGQSYALTAYWQAREPLSADFSTLAQLVDEDGHLYAGQDNLHPGTIPTSLWQPWNFVQDSHAVPILPGTPPGEYLLVTGLYNPDTWARLPVLAGGDSVRADVIAIPVTVEKAAHRPTLAELNIAWPVETNFGDELQLLGATPERDTIVRNDFLRVALFWEAVARPTQSYQIALQLLDAAGNVVLEQASHPSHNRYPTTRWSRGERVRDNHALRIPPDFPVEPGEYRLQVRVLDKAGQPLGEWVELGALDNK